LQQFLQLSNTLHQLPPIRQIRSSLFDKGHNVLSGYDPVFITQGLQDLDIFRADEQSEDLPGVVSAEP
jgi:hypothetical protein